LDGRKVLGLAAATETDLLELHQHERREVVVEERRRISPGASPMQDVAKAGRPHGSTTFSVGSSGATQRARSTPSRPGGGSGPHRAMPWRGRPLPPRSATALPPQGT